MFWSKLRNPYNSSITPQNRRSDLLLHKTILDKSRTEVSSSIVTELKIIQERDARAQKKARTLLYDSMHSHSYSRLQNGPKFVTELKLWQRVSRNRQRKHQLKFCSSWVNNIILIYSKIWIRLFLWSDTTILPSLRTAVEAGFLNSPILPPFVPNFVTNLPFRSNTWTLWFNSSQTIRCPALLTDKQPGVLNSPSPTPFFPNLCKKISLPRKHFNRIFVAIWYYKKVVILDTMKGNSERALSANFT